MPVQVRFTADHIGATMADSAGYDFRHLEDLASCPPQNANPLEGVFYAFHASDPPDASDFLTAKQREVFKDADECKRRSNSIWNDLSALEKRIKHVKRSNPQICRYISEGKMKEDHGVGIADENNSNHFSFWVCARSSMHKIFDKVVR